MLKLLRPCLSLIGGIKEQDDEIPKLSLDVHEASTENFASWLRSHPEIDTSEMSRRRLLNLYGEFCEFYDLKPLTQGRFDRGLKEAGFRRHRLSTPGRPWVYQLSSQDIVAAANQRPR
ncbi:MAG: hypothetical protein AB7U75_01995 [Hyphomicrobiaceae bacterium]